LRNKLQMREPLGRLHRLEGDGGGDDLFKDASDLLGEQDLHVIAWATTQVPSNVRSGDSGRLDVSTKVARQMPSGGREARHDEAPAATEHVARSLGRIPSPPP
jgi:hypothetical protein